MDDQRHVRKSNIFVEGRYRFGVNEQRILLSIISKIRISDTDFKPYRFNWGELRVLTKNILKNEDDINDMCEKLKNKTILLKEGKKTHGYGFLSGWTVDPGRSVEFRIDPAMKSMLLDLLSEGRFTLYKLECVLSLGSAYSIRLYELLKASEWKKQPIQIPLSDLKWKLGVPEGSMFDRRFDLFRTKILEKAKTDIEKHTDIKFNYKKILENRKVVALQISITENKKYQPTLQAHAGKVDVVRNGDRVLLEGKEYIVHGDGIMLNDGVLPIGRLNQLLKKGTVKKVKEQNEKEK